MLSLGDPDFQVIRAESDTQRWAPGRSAGGPSPSQWQAAANDGPTSESDWHHRPGRSGQPPPGPGSDARAGPLRLKARAPGY
jgi:hypothetical protein